MSTELDDTLKSMSNDDLASVLTKIEDILKERRDDDGPPEETALSRLVNYVQASDTGSVELGVITPFKELVHLRVTLLDKIVRN